jgi:hypothetical protein
VTRTWRSCAAGAAVFVCTVVARDVRAQGNLSGYGLGYPEGQLSTAALGTGGALGEFEPVSPINPASLGSVQSVTIHLQYDPEYRIVTVGGVTERSTTARFPLIMAAAPLGSHFVIGLSVSSFLDRTWSTQTTGPVAVGDTTVQSTALFKSDGGIDDIRLGVAWKILSWLRIGLAAHEFTGDDRITVQRIFADSDTVKTASFKQFNDYSINGYAASVGVEAQPSDWLGIAASYREGGTMRGRLGDTLVAKANVPPRAGGSIRLDPVGGLTIAGRVDWEGWSRLNGFGLGVEARDALELDGGLEVAGPRGSKGRPILFRVGARARNLPFLVNGQPVNETDVAGGFGIPIKQAGTLDLTLQHANRTANVGVGETAWTLSTGITIRP